MSGFTYNGIHSGKYSCYYIPNESDRWFASPEFELYEDEVPGRHGGYGYGDRVKIRRFEIKVFYEDITEETREKIRAWLDRKTSGELVFDERPFVSYKVRPGKTVDGKKFASNHAGMTQETYSGTFTVTFTAYEPFGFLKYKSYDVYDAEGAGIYTAMLESGEMPAAPTVSSREFLLFNPGTEECGTTIRIGGSAPSGLVIRNVSNGNECRILSLPTQGYIEIDSAKGTVTHVNGQTRTLAFQHHGGGYICLMPGTRTDDVVLSKTEGETQATLDGTETYTNLCGKYIRAGSGWVRITAQEGNVITLASAANRTEQIVTKIASMNQQQIASMSTSGTDDITLSKIEVDYTPLAL